MNIIESLKAGYRDMEHRAFLATNKRWETIWLIVIALVGSNVLTDRMAQQGMNVMSMIQSLVIPIVLSALAATILFTAQPFPAAHKLWKTGGGKSRLGGLVLLAVGSVLLIGALLPLVFFYGFGSSNAVALKIQTLGGFIGQQAFSMEAALVAGIWSIVLFMLLLFVFAHRGSIHHYEYMMRQEGADREDFASVPSIAHVLLVMSWQVGKVLVLGLLGFLAGRIAKARTSADARRRRKASRYADMSSQEIFEGGDDWRDQPAERPAQTPVKRPPTVQSVLVDDDSKVVPSEVIERHELVR